MQQEEFRAVVGRLEEVAAVVGKLDPEIRSQAFALLSGYVSPSGLSAAAPGGGMAGAVHGAADIDALVFTTMMQAAESARDDLRAIMDEVRTTNAAKRQLRDVIERVCRDIAQNVGADGQGQLTFADDGLGGEEAYHRVALPAHDAGCAGVETVASDLHPVPITDVRQLQAIRESLRNRLDGMSELGEMEQLRLQMAMDRYSKLMSTLSNILKKISDTEQGITQNLK